MSRTVFEEARNNLFSLCEVSSNVEVGGSVVSPDKKMVESRVMPVGDIEMGSTEGVRGQHLTKLRVFNGGNGDDSRAVMSGYLIGSLYMLDDSGLVHLIENEPVEFKIMLQEGCLQLKLEKLPLVISRKV